LTGSKWREGGESNPCLQLAHCLRPRRLSRSLLHADEPCKPCEPPQCASSVGASVGASVSSRIGVGICPQWVALMAVGGSHGSRGSTRGSRGSTECLPVGFGSAPPMLEHPPHQHESAARAVEHPSSRSERRPQRAKRHRGGSSTSRRLIEVTSKRTPRGATPSPPSPKPTPKSPRAAICIVATCSVAHASWLHAAWHMHRGYMQRGSAAMASHICCAAVAQRQPVAPSDNECKGTEGACAPRMCQRCANAARVVLALIGSLAALQ